MHTTAFDGSYVALDASGARWVAERGLKCVGIDYLSIAVLEDIAVPHRTLFAAGVVVIEGLDLSGVAPGMYTQVCLPAKMGGADGAPVRCVLAPIDVGDDADSVGGVGGERQDSRGEL